MPVNTFRLTVVTPDKLLVDEEVEKVAFQSTEGGMEVFYDHEPIVVTLGIGPLFLKRNEEEKVLAVSGGFAEIQPNKIMILSDAAEWPHEIDIDRAAKAKERAEKRLAQRDADLNFSRVEASLNRALLRIDIGKQNKR